ncbi:hypothetical protein COK88_24265 [Bacillus cereus]|uniref:hypothetical protein n=1 Tax=Bacillus cereus TaxID=1396 RepID=UPI000BF9829A|nr:hypothetical protein [Bacillus cereus]PFU46589.1 hypothetical protein COK88_24265 [Bacillus cereus]
MAFDLELPSIDDFNDRLNIGNFGLPHTICIFNCSGGFTPADVINVRYTSFEGVKTVSIIKKDYINVLMHTETEKFNDFSDELKEACKRMVSDCIALNERYIQVITDVVEQCKNSIIEVLNQIVEDGEQLAKMLAMAIARQQRVVEHPDINPGTEVPPEWLAGCVIVVQAVCVTVGCAILDEHPIAGGILIRGAWGFGPMFCPIAYDQIG